MIRLVNSKFRPPYRIFGNLPFSPSLPLWDLHISIVARVPITTMTSADFLAHRNRVYSKTSPSKSFFLHPIPAASTHKPSCTFRTLQWCACLSQVYMPLMPFLFVSTRFCSLASFSAYLTVNHPERIRDDLLTFRDVTPARKGLSPSGKIHLSFGYIKLICIFEIFQ